jgi:hypothetical protein
VVGIAGLDQHDSSNDRETRVVLHRPDLVDPLAALRAGPSSNRGRSLAFGARPDWGSGRLGARSGVRGVSDRLERVQDGAARRVSWSRPRGGV